MSEKTKDTAGDQPSINTSDNVKVTDNNQETKALESNANENNKDIESNHNVKAKHKISESIKNDFIDQADNKINELKRYDAEIKFSAKALQNQFDAIKQSLEDWAENQVQQNRIFENNITQLAREVTALTMVPEKIERNLNQTVPILVDHIQEKSLQPIKEGITKVYGTIDDLEKRIQLISSKINDINSKSFKKKILPLVLIISLTTFSSTALAYAIMKLLPQTVNILAGGSISVDRAQKVEIIDMSKNIPSSAKKSK